MIFRSREQQHSFNFPVQIGTEGKDTPDDGENYELDVVDGDITVVGSDGLFDNVFDNDIIDIIAMHLGKKSEGRRDGAQSAADALLKKAREVAEDDRFATSPFQEHAIQEGFYFQGGKVDDITILVGLIKNAEDSPDRR